MTPMMMRTVFGLVGASACRRRTRLRRTEPRPPGDDRLDLGHGPAHGAVRDRPPGCPGTRMSLMIRRRLQVGDLVLQAVADLDPDLPVVGHDEQDQAVVQALAADLPGLEGLDRVLLDGIAAGRPADIDEDLVAARPLPGLEPGVQLPQRAPADRKPAVSVAQRSGEARNLDLRLRPGDRGRRAGRPPRRRAATRPSSRKRRPEVTVRT